MKARALKTVPAKRLVDAIHASVSEAPAKKTAPAPTRKKAALLALASPLFAKASGKSPAYAEEAAALGLMQPLDAQLLDEADTLCRVTEVVAKYCYYHGADHVADLLECASMLSTQRHSRLTDLKLAGNCTRA